jgi:hypothetical protein
MSEPSVDATRCPLCQQPNACQIAAGQKTCWCFSVTMDSSAIDRVPAEAKGRACLCRACGVKPAPTPQQKP